MGAGEQRLARDFAFGAENGAEALRRHFRHVELRDAGGTVKLGGRDAVVRYVESMEAWRHLADRVPAIVDPELAARRSNVVFVAQT